MRLVRATAAVLRKRHPRPGPALGSVGSAGGGGFSVQYYVGHYRGPNLTLTSFALLALVICAAAIGVELLGRVVPRWRRSLRARWRERRRLLAGADIERRPRALMSELCPHGWRAQITLFGPADVLPADAPEGERARVALDWAELQDDSGDVAVTRRVWAPTIGEALDAMVADRRTDETLEQIERRAGADDAPWPDIYL